MNLREMLKIHPHADQKASVCDKYIKTATQLSFTNKNGKYFMLFLLNGLFSKTIVLVNVLNTCAFCVLFQEVFYNMA